MKLSLLQHMGRFSSPGVLSPDFCPIPLDGFVQGMPCMALATRALGSESAASAWMCAPAAALDQRRPADVLLTEPQLVHDLLVRMERGAAT